MRPLGYQEGRPLARTTMVLGLSAVLTTGCGPRITDRNLDEVKPDMSKKEVESILGQPTDIKSHELTLQTQMKTLQATRYYYEQAGHRVELIFVADKLVGKNGHFEVDGVVATRVAERANSDQPIPGVSAGAPMVLQEVIEINDEPSVAEPAPSEPAPPAVEPALPIRDKAAGSEPTPPVISEGIE